MTGTDGLVLPVPELVDVIPVEQADAIIAVARQELADLSHEVDAAVLAADAAERHAASQGADPALAGQAAEQLQAFIEHRRAETDAELKLLLDEASAQAGARIDDARAEADRITADARRVTAGPSTPRPLAPSFLAQPFEPEPILPRPTDPPKVTPSAAAPSVVRTAPFVESPPAIFPGHVFLDDDMPPAVPDDPATAAASVLAAAPGPSEPLWLESPLLGASRAASPEPVAPPEAVAPPAPPAPAAPVVTPAAPAAGPAAAVPEAVVPPGAVAPAAEAPSPAPAKARLGSVPVFAVLQVVGLLAVLVILLVFVN
ncbi:hypothetical protein [Aquihabitans sp. McL0605]|uniref:hypothetical protein n=1 Tax=Aquihabitans sp. McL0605 TaxID=3415671 RepID=UPI003CEB9CB3